VSGTYWPAIEVKELHGTPITTTYNGYINIINSGTEKGREGFPSKAF
jgi:hypothetical protein